MPVPGEYCFLNGLRRPIPLNFPQAKPNRRQLVAAGYSE
jgi:hypothetical protein